MQLLAVGIALTLIGLIGLAILVREGRRGTIIFVIFYGLGALCLIGGGLWWLIHFSRGRDSRR